MLLKTVAYFQFCIARFNSKTYYNGVSKTPSNTMCHDAKPTRVLAKW